MSSYECIHVCCSIFRLLVLSQTNFVLGYVGFVFFLAIRSYPVQLFSTNQWRSQALNEVGALEMRSSVGGLEPLKTHSGSRAEPW